MAAQVLLTFPVDPLASLGGMRFVSEASPQLAVEENMRKMPLT